LYAFKDLYLFESHLLRSDTTRRRCKHGHQQRQRVRPRTIADKVLKYSANLLNSCNGCFIFPFVALELVNEAAA
jgi:hypothetical protein